MVSSPRVKINPAVLTWAREWFNMSTAYVAKKMNGKSITEETIEAWETGEKQPTYTQLEKLSEILEKPLEIFFYPDAPNIPKPSALYRSVYGGYTQEIPTAILKIISHTKNFQNTLRELTYGKNPAEKKITDITISGTIEEQVQTVREIIGISLEEQKSCSSFTQGFEMWRNAFAKVGIYVVKEPFGTTAYSGFCLIDNEFPVICVNNTMGYQRQIFTLFHELYHLISKQNGVDLTDDSSVLPRLTSEMQVLERNCDRFAAEFLVPSKDFNNEIESIPDYQNLLESGSYLEIVQNILSPLSKKYCVSQDVILHKLADEQYITQDHSYHLHRKHTTDSIRDPGNKGGGNYYSNQVCYLGRPYISLVMESQQKYGIPDYVTAEYLHTTVQNIPQLFEAAMKGGK